MQPLLQWKSNQRYIFWECVYSLRYPVCNAHAPYCHLWPDRLWQHLSTLSHKRHDFRKIVVEHKVCVLIFSTVFLRNISHSKKNWARYYLVFMWSTCYFRQNWMKLDFLPDFRKILKYHISRKSVQWEPSFSMRTDGQTDTTKLIVDILNFEKALKDAGINLILSF